MFGRPKQISLLDDENLRVMILASGDLWAGAEVMVYELCRGLNQIDKVEIIIVLLNDGILAKKLAHAGFKVMIADESKLSLLSLLKHILNIATDFTPHVIHSHRYKENILAWLVALVMGKMGLVSTQHGMPEIPGGRQSIFGRLKQNLNFWLLSSCFDRTVFVSHEMEKSLLGAYGFSKEKVTVIHNGIALDSHNSLMASEAMPGNNRLTIGSAGRLFPVKDYSLMIEVARLVVSQTDAISFALAGDGPEEDLLRQKILDYGLQERFELVGFQEDMQAFYRGLDVYISTSVHEGIPMSVLEAMSHGVPVIAPHVGGFPEIVEDGVSGFLIRHREAFSFAEKILGMLNEDCRASMASAARMRVEQFFSCEAMARKYYQVYRERYRNT